MTFSENEKDYECFPDIKGNKILTYDYIERLRNQDKDKPIPGFCAAQKGGQENALASNAKIVVFGSARGPGKSFGGIMNVLYDIDNPNFTAVALRNEKPDLDSLITTSQRILSDFGTYVSSEKSMCWNFDRGGHLYFSYHAGNIDDFKIRFQGKERCYCLVDESTHVSDFSKILYLTTILRNSYGIRCHMMLTCNPDSRSYLKTLIDWYIGHKDTVYADGQLHPERAGYPIPERDGKRRYVFFAGGENLSDAVWGDTPDEVYGKCKSKIDALWKPEYAQYGDPKELFIHSIEFYGAKLSDNIKLMQSDPSYLANLANQSDEQIARDLEGNWEWEDLGTDVVTVGDMNRFFDNPPQFDDNILRAAQDVAFLGGDNCFTWLARGKHIIDVDVSRMDGKAMIEHTKQLLAEWGVDERNFVYDSNGLGQVYKGFFKKSIPFNNLEAPWCANRRDEELVRKDYDTFKSQCCFSLADAIKYGEVSIAPHVLEKRVSGKGYDNITIKDMLLQERRVFNIDETKRDRGKGKCMRQKADMKKELRRSPDGTEGLIYLWSHFVKVQPPRMVHPVGAARYISSNGYNGGQSVKRSHHTRGFVRYR